MTLFQGYFVAPTVITDLSDDSRCMREEIFGPVTCIVPFDTEEEVRGGILYLLDLQCGKHSIFSIYNLSRIVKNIALWT